jgi:hypothetical protein
MQLNRLIGGGIVLLLVFLTGCMSLQSVAFPIGAKRPPPKPEDAKVFLFKEAKPTQPYETLARLNVHIEKTFLIPSAFEEALPELEKLARHQGADALTDVEEKKSRLNETFIYNVTATAVVFIH